MVTTHGPRRQTIAHPVTLEGIGLHLGLHCRITFRPAPGGRGAKIMPDGGLDLPGATAKSSRAIAARRAHRAPHDSSAWTSPTPRTLRTVELMCSRPSQEHRPRRPGHRCGRSRAAPSWTAAPGPSSTRYVRCARIGCRTHRLSRVSRAVKEPVRVIDGDVGVRGAPGQSELEARHHDRLSANH